MRARGLLRPLLLALLVAAIWIATLESAQPHRVRPVTAPATQFSAARAERLLAAFLANGRPHPVGSVAEATVRSRLLSVFAQLGVPVQPYQRFVCNTWRGFAYIPCATVTDLIAQVLPGQGPAILMVAHYDSVPAGPGAADDGAGVAAVLEAARALRAQAALSGTTRTLHPVVALLTDGEEAGLLGAQAFLQDPKLSAGVGVVVNLEARGASGSSLLFQTSRGDGELVRLYATHAPQVAGSSLFPEVYRFLPNDTDLTLFLRAGSAGLNFAFADNERYYHTPLDRVAQLAPGSLQMQGDNLLAVVSALETTPFAALRSSDAQYLTLFNRLMLRMPARGMLPLALVVLLALLLLSWARLRTVDPHSADSPPATLWMAVLPLIVVAGAELSAWLLVALARGVSQTAEPAYAHPTQLQVALALGVWSVALLAGSRCQRSAGAMSVWLWFAVLGVVTSVAMPGLAAYLVWPSGLAAMVLAGATRAPEQLAGPARAAALLLPAVAALLAWIGLAVSAQRLLPAALYPLWVGALALAVAPLVPLIAPARTTRAPVVVSAALSAAAAIALTLYACTRPVYTAQSPERLNLSYLQSPAGARWLADTSWDASQPHPLPATLLRAAPFQLQETGWTGAPFAYVADATNARLPLPRMRVLEQQQGVAEQFMRLQLSGSADTAELILDVPAAAGLRDLQLRGQHIQLPPGWHGATRLACVGSDCQQLGIAMHMTRGPVTLTVTEQRYDLPPSGDFLLKARPASAVPSQDGDRTLLVNQLLLR